MKQITRVFIHVYVAFFSNHISNHVTKHSEKSISAFSAGADFVMGKKDRWEEGGRKESRKRRRFPLDEQDEAAKLTREISLDPGRWSEIRFANWLYQN